MTMFLSRWNFESIFSDFVKIIYQFLLGSVMPQVIQPIVAGAALSFGVLLVLAVSNGVSSLLFNQTVSGFVDKRVGA